MHPQDPKESTAEPPAQGATQDAVSSGSLGASGAEADDWRARKREYDRHDDGLGPYMQWAFQTSKVIALRRGYWAEFQSWADLHLGQGFSMACADGDLLDQVTQSCFEGYIAGREYRDPSTAAPVEAASEAPSQPQASERELPPLPEPNALLIGNVQAGVYTADQLRERDAMWLARIDALAARAQEPDQDEPSADAREPLSDERIVNLFQESFPRTKYSAAWKSFARAIEAEHGIGSKE
jgi:hypothetical protein